MGFAGRHVAEIAQSLLDSSSCVCAGSRRVGAHLTTSHGCVSHDIVGCNECNAYCMSSTSLLWSLLAWLLYNQFQVAMNMKCDEFDW